MTKFEARAQSRPASGVHSHAAMHSSRSAKNVCGQRGAAARVNLQAPRRSQRASQQSFERSGVDEDLRTHFLDDHLHCKRPSVCKI